MSSRKSTPIRQIWLLAIFIMGNLITLFSQEQEIVALEKLHDHPAFKHFRIGMALSHTYIGTSTLEGEQTIIVPSVGLDVEYWVNHRWGIGFHNDLEIESFIIEENQEESIEKKYPALVTFDALMIPWKGLVLLTGFGIEFEKTDNLQVIRFGIEYEIEFSHNWDVFPTVFYDSRIDNHNTFSVGLGVGKRF